MRLIFLAIATALLLVSAQAQDCRADVPKAQNKPFAKKLWNGYEVSLGPARNSLGRGDECTAAIYNRAGRVVFRTTGYSVILDADYTGTDFDADGLPEVVFLTDTGGEARCCWDYNVISLSPKPHKLFDIDESAIFEKDEQGKMIIWQRIPGPTDFTTTARRPFAAKIFRVHDGKLVDATPEFCSRIFSAANRDYEFWTTNLKPENLTKLQSAGPAFENEDTLSALLSRALQNVFCQRFDAALNDLNLWPEPTRMKMKAGFADFIKESYPEFAGRLTSRADVSH